MSALTSDNLAKIPSGEYLPQPDARPLMVQM